MKSKISKHILILIISMLLMPMTVISSYAGIVSYEESIENSSDGIESDSVEILFTHDIHSYLESYDVIEDGISKNVGGMERLSTLVNEFRSKNPDALLFDGGDYPMGTLYQTLYETDALEYQMLSKLGFDAITFGNHDFDYGPEAMVGHFNAAKSACDYYPQFVVCNIDWDYDNSATKELYSVMKDMNLCEYYIIERNGIKIGITGVLGYDALDCAPTCELNVLDPIESVSKTVEKLKKEEKVDMVICLSHSGTVDNLSKSEDVILAKKVPDIDFILSAHSHTVLNEAIKVGNTYIGSCGCYGRYTGHVVLKKNQKGRFDLEKYELISMDDDVTADEKIVSQLEQYKTVIDESYLNNYEYNAKDVVATNDVVFSTVDDLYFKHDEQNLGNIIADSYRWAAGLMDGNDLNNVDVAIAPAGTIRGSYYLGDITVADVYNSFSLGRGADGTVGYPLISVYLTGEELRTACELDASISILMNAARLYMSGLEFTYNPNRAFLNKVTEAHLNRGLMESDTAKIENDKLYRVVTDMYSGRMLGAVTDLSKGLLSIVPKKADGSVVENLDDVIIHDADGNEVKAWVAIARYMESTDSDRDGIGNIPEYYSITTGRKTVIDSKSSADNLSNLNVYAVTVMIVILALVAIIVLIVTLVVRVIIKKSKSKLNKNTNKKDDASE